MKQVGIFEAKTHLSALVDEVAKGGEIVITRHGRPVAKLVSCEGESRAKQLAARRRALAELREMARQRGLRIPLNEIKSWIDEGRP